MPMTYEATTASQTITDGLLFTTARCPGDGCGWSAAGPHHSAVATLARKHDCPRTIRRHHHDRESELAAAWAAIDAEYEYGLSRIQRLAANDQEER